MTALNGTRDAELRNQLKSMSGWCDPLKAIALVNLVISNRATSCLEVGVFSGKSLLSIAFGLRELGGGTVHGIDSWEKADCIVDGDPKDAAWWSNNVDLPAIYNECLKHIATTNLERFITLHRMSSLVASKSLDGPFDLIHIDGCHSEWSSTSDVTLWLPRLRPGGIAVMDDVNWPSTQTAVRFVKKFCDEISITNTPESVFGIFKKR